MKTHRGVTALMVAAAVMLAATSEAGYQHSEQTPATAVSGGGIAMLTHAVSEPMISGTPRPSETNFRLDSDLWTADSRGVNPEGLSRNTGTRWIEPGARTVEGEEQRLRLTQMSGHTAYIDKNDYRMTGDQDKSRGTRAGWQGGSRTREQAPQRRALSLRHAEG